MVEAIKNNGLILSALIVLAGIFVFAVYEFIDGLRRTRWWPFKKKSEGDDGNV